MLLFGGPSRAAEFPAQGLPGLMTEAMGRTGVRTCLRTGLILVMPMVKATPEGKRSTILIL